MIFFLRSLQYNALAVCHRIISEKNSHGFHDKQTYGSVLLFMKKYPGCVSRISQCKYTYIVCLMPQLTETFLHAFHGCIQYKELETYKFFVRLVCYLYGI